MFKRKVINENEMKFAVTNYLYPVGKPEVDPILTDRDIEEFRQFRLEQQAQWDADRVYRQAHVRACALQFQRQRENAVDKGERI